MAESPVTPQLKAKNNQSLAISSDILDDLASRFIINVPDEERQNLIRICFQIELAHWFYIDFYCSTNKPKCGIKHFAYQMFQHIPFLRPYVANMEKILEDWKQYKLSVPTYGAILLSEDSKNVLLVQSFWAKSSWGFPKGKINENEKPVNCAIREVYEETGFDTSKLIDPDEYIELILNYQYTRLYIVKGVPIKTVFIPRTRNEIRCCEWFPIELLPTSKHDNVIKDNLSMTGNSFFMILPFIKCLRTKLQKNNKHNHRKSLGIINSPILMSGVKGKTNIGGNNYDQNKSGSNNSNNIVTNNRRTRHKSMGDIEQRAKPNNGTTPFFLNNYNYQQKNNQIDDGNAINRSAVFSTIQESQSNNKKHASHVTKRKLFGTPKQDVTNELELQLDKITTWLNFSLDFNKFLN